MLRNVCRCKTKQRKKQPPVSPDHADLGWFRPQKGKAVYYAVQQVGVCGSGRVWRGLHLSSQVTRAVQGIRGSPPKESLLSIEEDELQGEVRTGGLRGSRSDARVYLHRFSFLLKIISRLGQFS